MYWENDNWNEVVELSDKIKKAGFLEQTLRYKDPSSGETTELEIFNRIRKMGTAEGETGAPDQFRRHHEKREDKLPGAARLLNHARKVDSFFYEYAKTLWTHKQSMDRGAGQKLIRELKRDTLQQISQFLKGLEFKGETIKEALRPLAADIDQQLNRWRAKHTGDYHYFVMTSPLGQAWQVRENGAISKIRSLYLEYTPLSDRQVRYNMTLVFEAVGLVPHDRKADRLKRFRQKLKKRFGVIDKYPLAYSEPDIADPNPVPPPRESEMSDPK